MHGGKIYPPTHFLPFFPKMPLFPDKNDDPPLFLANFIFDLTIVIFI